MANVITSTCRVSPIFRPWLLSTAVDDLLRNVPAADSQLIDDEKLAPVDHDTLASVRTRYVILHDNVTFCPRIGGLDIATPHVGFGSEIPHRVTEQAYHYYSY